MSRLGQPRRGLEFHRRAIKIKTIQGVGVVSEGPLSANKGTLRVEYFVSGKPIGKPRMTRRDKWAQRPTVMRYREWADNIRLSCFSVPEPEKIIELNWTASFAMPKSWSKSKKIKMNRQLHRQTPDRDNIDKAVLDALFKKDQAISAGTIKKVWGEKDFIIIEVFYEEGKA